MPTDKKFKMCRLRLDEDPDLNAQKVRDAIVECFVEAQGEVLARTMRRLGVAPTPAKLKEKVTAIVRTAFRETGGSFDEPNAAAIRRALDYLAKKAASWGTPEEIIEFHLGQFRRAVERLERKGR